MGVRCQRGHGWDLLVCGIASLLLSFLLALSSPHPPSPSLFLLSPLLILLSISPFLFSLFLISILLPSLLHTSLPLIPFLRLSSFSPPLSTTPFFLLLPPPSSSSSSLSSEQTHPAHPHSPGLCRCFRPLHPPTRDPQPIPGPCSPLAPGLFSAPAPASAQSRSPEAGLVSREGKPCPARADSPQNRAQGRLLPLPPCRDAVGGVGSNIPGALAGRMSGQPGMRIGCSLWEPAGCSGPRSRAAAMLMHPMAVGHTMRP